MFPMIIWILHLKNLLRHHPMGYMAILVCLIMILAVHLMNLALEYLANIVYINKILFNKTELYSPKESFGKRSKRSERSNKDYNHNNSLTNLLKNTIKNKGTISTKSIIFIDNYILPKYNDVCPDGKRSIEIVNAGGKSEISEMFSIDYYAKKYNAYDTLMEMEIEYWIDYKMVDYICTIDEIRIGVSVARAMGYPNPDKFTYEKAQRLLYKKLYGLIIARNSVVKKQSFYRSILHIWCQSETIAQLLKEAYENINDDEYLDVKGILVLQLTVCDDEQLYKNFLI